MEDIAYLLVPFAQIAFGAATVGAIILGMDDKKSKLRAYLVPIVMWGWIFAASGAAALPVGVKFKYRDMDTAPYWMPTTVPALLIYGAVFGMIIGCLIGTWLGRNRWKIWQRELAQAPST